MAAAIQVAGLRKEFEDLVAVDDLTFSILPQEIYGLIGPNGAGKTTTMRMIAGLLSPTAGTLLVGDVDVAKNPSEARSRIGFLSDFFGVYEDLKVWEYLDYFARAYRLASDEIGKRVADAIGQTGLGAKRDSIIRGLSRGMKQKLGIARSVLHRPSVLVLDEPASGLDPMARMELRNLLQVLQSQGTTIFISSHILPELDGFCTSIGIMEKGRLVRSGRVAEIMAAETTSHMFRMSWIESSPSLVRSVMENHPQVSNLAVLEQTGTFQFLGSDAELSEILSDLIAARIRVVFFGEVKDTVEDLYMKISRREVV